MRAVPPSRECRRGNQRSRSDIGVDLDVLLERPHRDLAERGSAGDRSDELDDRLDDVADGSEMPDADVDRCALDVGSDGGSEVRIRDVRREDEVDQPVSAAQRRALAGKELRDHVRDELRRLLPGPIRERGS